MSSISFTKSSAPSPLGARSKVSNPGKIHSPFFEQQETTDSFVKFGASRSSTAKEVEQRIKASSKRAEFNQDRLRNNAAIIETKKAYAKALLDPNAHPQYLNTTRELYVKAEENKRLLDKHEEKQGYQN